MRVESAEVNVSMRSNIFAASTQLLQSSETDTLIYLSSNQMTVIHTLRPLQLLFQVGYLKVKQQCFSDNHEQFASIC